VKNWWASDTSLKDNAMEASDATDSFVRNHAGVSDQVQQELRALAAWSKPMALTMPRGRLSEGVENAANILEEVALNKIQRGIALLAPPLIVVLGSVITSVVLAFLRRRAGIIGTF
jgi:type II secretory pathway component PulF